MSVVQCCIKWLTGRDQWCIQWLTGRDQWTTGRDQWLTGRDQWLTGRDQWLPGRDQWLTSRDQWFSRHYVDRSRIMVQICKHTLSNVPGSDPEPNELYRCSF